jgi:hypothetical protein
MVARTTGALIWLGHYLINDQRIAPDTEFDDSDSNGQICQANESIL